MESHDRDQFDELLDGALKRYASAEPRAGLEGRVLARMAGVERKGQRRSSWAWGLAPAASVCIAIVVIILLRSPHSQQPVPEHPLSAGNGTARNALVVPHDRERSVVRRHATKSGSAKKMRRPGVFPSPRPLSEQETMLVEYVEHNPQEAILVAKEQDEFQKRVEQAEKEIDASSSSDQQER